MKPFGWRAGVRFNRPVQLDVLRPRLPQLRITQGSIVVNAGSGSRLPRESGLKLHTSFATHGCHGVDHPSVENAMCVAAVALGSGSTG